MIYFTNFSSFIWLIVFIYVCPTIFFNLLIQALKPSHSPICHCHRLEIPAFLSLLNWIHQRPPWKCCVHSGEWVWVGAWIVLSADIFQMGLKLNVNLIIYGLSNFSAIHHSFPFLITSLGMTIMNRLPMASISNECSPNSSICSPSPGQTVDWIGSGKQCWCLFFHIK